jgi:hypothetical protein
MRRDEKRSSKRRAHAPIKSDHLRRRTDRFVHCVHNPPRDTVVDDLGNRAEAKP